MNRRPATWKIVAFGTALTGLGLAGAGAAVADDGRDSAPLPAGVSVGNNVDKADASPADAALDSADSPSVIPGAAPADAQPADVDADSVDSPHGIDSPNDVDSPNDDA